VVDDEEDILTAVRVFLEGSLPIDVQVASSAEVALEALRSGARFDLVLSDYRMPGMDGLRFLEQAKISRPEVPRILMTAFPDMKLAIQALNRAGILKFITKPVSPDDLVQIVAAALSIEGRASGGTPAPVAADRMRARPDEGV
jgi:DNA-binding NtrC family response regulator